jgi:hypothetical protein
MKTFKQFISESTPSQFDIAYSIAKKAHTHDRDQSGSPYINHVKSVIKKVSRYGDDIKAIAALHDVIEDTNITKEDLQAAGIKKHILDAVVAITRRKGESKNSYYSRVKQNRLARIVKLADIEDNLDPRRLKKLPSDTARRLRIKYLKARSIIESSFLDNEEVLLYETVLVERAKADIQVQPWAGGKFDAKSLKTREVLQKLYDEIVAFVSGVQKTFVRLLHRSASHKTDKVLFNVKTFDSFINKVVTRGYNPKAMTDIIRGAILANDEEGVQRIVKNLRRFARIQKYEYKRLGGDPKLGYYGSHHIDIQIGNVIAEIQIMTKRLWIYKMEAHKIYDELRGSSDLGLSDAEIRRLVQRSKNLFYLGNR